MLHLSVLSEKEALQKHAPSEVENIAYVKLYDNKAKRAEAVRHVS